MRMLPRRLSRLVVAALCVVVTDPLAAQPKTRPLGPIIAASTDSLGVRVAVRALPGGKVLVNDINRRRLLLFDATLSSSQVVMDSAASSANAGMPVPIASAVLIPFAADSTLYVDIATQALLVLDPNGKVGHVMALPRPRDAMTMASGYANGSPAIDAKGRLVYRGLILPAPGRMDGGALSMPQLPDSSPIVRADFDKRTIDTLIKVKAANSTRTSMAPDKDGNYILKLVFDPFESGDEWAMLADGTIGVLRAHDYHVDWIDPDGTRRTTPKMPFDWKRLTDERKQFIIDSIKPAMERAMTQQRSSLPTMPTPNGPRKVVPQFEFVSADKMPDYEPAIAPGALRADLDNNLWIVPRTTIGVGTGGVIHDVVNRKGEIIDRVQFPKGRALAGFGPDGVVYMVHVTGRTAILERAKLR